MRKAFTKLLWSLLAGSLAVASPLAAQQVNPGTQIKWPSGCTSGMPYIPFTNNCTAISSGITSLTGPVTAAGSGAVATTITPTGVAAGTYPAAANVITVNVAGQVTAIGPPFTASLVCATNVLCNTVEVGSNTVSPAGFTASYTNPTLPVSASLSDGTNSTTLTTPFTSGSLAFRYCTVAQGTSSFTFTLTSVGNGQTVTSTQTETCAPRFFGGVGTAGATGATASSSSAVLVTATGTLASAGLANSQVGSTIGPYSPSGQKVYLLLIGGSHTFKDAVTGFAFAFNAPTAVSFVNQNGATVTMYLYESTNTLTGTYSVLVVS